MIPDLRLKRKLDPNSMLHKTDIINTKKALGTLGYYNPPSWGLSDVVDQNMFTGIAHLQGDQALKKDGVMKPGGETEVTINALLKGKKREDKKGRRKNQSNRLIASQAQNKLRNARPKAFGDNLAQFKRSLLETGLINTNSVPLPLFHEDHNRRHPAMAEKDPAISGGDKKSMAQQYIQAGNNFEKLRLKRDQDTVEKTRRDNYHLSSWMSDFLKSQNDFIDLEAEKQGVDPYLVKAIIMAEHAKDRNGEIFKSPGTLMKNFPMNIDPGYWDELGITQDDFKNSQNNIKAGIRLIKHLSNSIQYPTTEKIATLWNAEAREQRLDKVSHYATYVGHMYDEIWHEYRQRGGESNAVYGVPFLHKGDDRKAAINKNQPGKIVIEENAKASDQPDWYRLDVSPKIGRKAVLKHETSIDQEAKRQGVNADLIKAIVFSENARGHYLGLSKVAEISGLANSIFPMNLNPEIWGDLGITKETAYNAEDNIRAGVKLIKRLHERIENPTPEKIATLYNATAKDKINNYGAYVARIMREKPWLK